jgi:hypothetical protein
MKELDADNRRTVFPLWSVQRLYKQGKKLFFSEFCAGGCEDRISAREAEEPPMLVAVARERLVKTQQAGKGLACAVVICELWRLAVAV